MTAIAVAHHVPYAAQAAASHWHDLSVKVERAAAAEGPAFLNVLTDCPRGLGARAATGASRTRTPPSTAFSGRCTRLLTATADDQPEKVVPIEDWLRPQKRFAHLVRPEHRALVEEIQLRVDSDWEDLLRLCQGGDLP